MVPATDREPESLRDTRLGVPLRFPCLSVAMEAKRKTDAIFQPCRSKWDINTLFGRHMTREKLFLFGENHFWGGGP